MSAPGDGAPRRKRYTLFRGLRRAAGTFLTLGLVRRARGAGRASRRGVRAPPLASMTYGVLEEDSLDLEHEQPAELGGRPSLKPASGLLGGLQDALAPILSHPAALAATRGSFPLVLHPVLAHRAQEVHAHDEVHHFGIQHDDRHFEQHHVVVTNGYVPVGDGANELHHPHHHHHHQYHHSGHQEHSGDTWRRSELQHGGGPCTCCGGAGAPCSAHSHHQQQHHHHQQHGGHVEYRASHSAQQLLAVGSRQWGSGGWWDTRGLLRVKLYDFAIYADAAKAREVLGGSPAPQAHAHGGPRGLLPPPLSSSSSSSVSLSPAAAAEALRRPASGVDMSLTIRAARNLPLPLLGAEFERVLQRRHERAGGRPDDPAFRELLSYFTAQRLPAGVMVPPGRSEEPAVRKGAAITFSRSASGDLLTEAGGYLLGRVRSPALAEALFDLYLGDQPVSKKAKAAAGAALLQLAAGADLRYRLQPGERLLCPGGGDAADPSACLVELA